jgi:hypothetical protein
MAFTDRTVFYGTYETEWVRTEEPQEGGGPLVRKDYAGLVPNLCLVYPLPGNLSLGTGLVVERRKGGRIEVDNITASGQDYRQVFDAKGNVLLFPALFAGKIGGIGIGGGLDVVLLNSEIRWRNEFPDDSGFDDSDDLDKISLWGVAWKLGARVPVRSRFVIGGWFSWPSNLDGSRRIENDDPFDSADDLKLDLTGEIASKWSLGIEMTALSNVRILGDWVHENWEDAEPLSVIDRHVNVDRLAAGIEWNREAGGERLNWPVRVGYRTETLHVIDGKGQEVREHVLTAGSGFGLASGRGVIDWYLEYGWRGVRDETEYYEQLVRFGVTLTGLEKWSRRRKPEEEEDW